MALKSIIPVPMIQLLATKNAQYPKNPANAATPLSSFASPIAIEIENKTGINVNTIPDTLFNVEIINNGTVAAKNGIAPCTCGFINADVSPRTIPHAAKAAIGIIRLLPRSEKKFIILFFIIKLHFLIYNTFTSLFL